MWFGAGVFCGLTLSETLSKQIPKPPKYHSNMLNMQKNFTVKPLKAKVKPEMKAILKSAHKPTDDAPRDA